MLFKREHATALQYKCADIIATHSDDVIRADAVVWCAVVCCLVAA